jgi:hypothetical protein
VASVVGLLLMLVTGGAAMRVTLGGLMRMLARSRLFVCDIRSTCRMRARPSECSRTSSDALGARIAASNEGMRLTSVAFLVAGSTHA